VAGDSARFPSAAESSGYSLPSTQSPRLRGCPHHARVGLPHRAEGTARGLRARCRAGSLPQSPSACLIYVRESVSRVSRLSTAVATVAGRPLFINGEPVFAFTYARLPAITHQRHTRARVPRALPAAAPRRECIVVKVIAVAGPLSRAEDGSVLSPCP
jgi:hypothetical protein